MKYNNQTPINYKNIQTFQNYYYSHPNQSIYHQLQTKSSQQDTQKSSNRDSINISNNYLGEFTEYQRYNRNTDRQINQINQKLSNACLKIQELSNKSLSRQKHGKSIYLKKQSKNKCIHKKTKQNIQDEYYPQSINKVGKFYNIQEGDNHLNKTRIKTNQSKQYQIFGSQNKQNQSCYFNVVYQTKKPENLPMKEQKMKIFQLDDQKQLLFIELQKAISSKNIFIRSLEDKIQNLKAQSIKVENQYLKKQSKLLQKINQLQDYCQLLENQSQMYKLEIDSFKNNKEKHQNNLNLTQTQNKQKMIFLQKNLLEIIQLCLDWTNLMQRAKQQQLPTTAFMVREQLVSKRNFFKNIYNEILKQQNKSFLSQNQSFLLKNSYFQAEKLSKKNQKGGLMKCSSIKVISQPYSSNKNRKKSSKQSLKKNINKSKSQNKELTNYRSRTKKDIFNELQNDCNRINTIISNYHSQTINIDQKNQKLQSKQKMKELQNQMFYFVKKELFCQQRGSNKVLFKQQLKNEEQFYRILLIQACQIQEIKLEQNYQKQKI